jgi:hypothetical protein
MNGIFVLLSIIIVILISMLRKATHTINLLSDECVRLTDIIQKHRENKDEPPRSMD